MSEILVNKLTGTTTAGSILVTGEGNSTTTNLQQGLCKSWITSVDNGTSISDSLNVSSTADTATGRQKVAITNAFASTTTISCAACGMNTSTNNGSGNNNRTCVAIRGDSASEIFFNSLLMSDGTLIDVNISQYHATGDLA
tara:strand:+ start:249 stop:671 length:423 start_codon:yes stop_codon:yes gene_type:complete